MRADPVRVLTGAGALALVAMMAWIVADVALRTAFGRPLHGSIDFVETALVLVAFLGLPECFRRDEQIKVDVFDRLMSPRRLSQLRLVGEVCTLIFLCVLAAALLRPLLDAYRFGDQKADLPIPIWGLLLAIEVALIAAAAAVSVRVYRQSVRGETFAVDAPAMAALRTEVPE